MRWMAASSHRGVREPAVAGQFYAGRPERLSAEVDRYLADARAALGRAGGGVAGDVGARAHDPGHARQVAIVVPHAGHVYSGPTAGYAYAAIDPDRVRRVVLLGPAHYVPVDGIGTSTATAWRTPLGDIALDGDLATDLREHFDDVFPADESHAPEHSLEVQLPFLQRVLAEGWRLVPLIVGADVPDELATVLARCAALPDTLIVVSTDLSHYLDHDSAVARDSRTIEAIVARRAVDIGSHDACGRYPLRGLLLAAVHNDWTVHLLDARNSGDTAGGWDRVVGYAAFLVTARSGDGRGAAAPGSTVAEGAPGVAEAPGAAEVAGAAGVPGAVAAPAGPRIAPATRAALLGLARRTITDALATGRRPRFDAARAAAEDPALADPVLQEPGAAFVTLRSASGDLLGCIGSLSARQPLVADVAEHAFDAAFRDPRFLPLAPERAEGMVIDVSVLSPTRPFPCSGWADLMARVPVGSGVVVEAGRHRATFLPAVWEQLPGRPEFLAALWRKAGLVPGEWPTGTSIEVYDSEEFAES